MKKKNFAFKLDPQSVEAARRKGFDLPEAIRNLVESLAASKSCPLCGKKSNKKSEVDPWIEI